MMQTCVYLKFFVLEAQRIHDRLVYDWLLDQAKDLGLHGGSAFRAVAGYGRHGIRHEAHFFELAGQLPLEVVFVASREDAQRLIDAVGAQDLSLFYYLMPAECGTTGSPDP
jgi:PII-like signaling protein